MSILDIIDRPEQLINVITGLEPRKTLIYTGFLKLCPGKRHAWYETNLGYPIRKELGKIKI